MVILENIDIDKAILQNIDIDKISNRFKFGISNRATGRASNPLLNLPKPDISCESKLIFGRPPKGNRGVVAV